jgi:hypothetical protein
MPSVLNREKFEKKGFSLVPFAIGVDQTGREPGITVVIASQPRGMA